MWWGHYEALSTPTLWEKKDEQSNVYNMENLHLLDNYDTLPDLFPVLLTISS